MEYKTQMWTRRKQGADELKSNTYKINGSFPINQNKFHFSE